jgi:plasmid stabilization system protein ParE
MTVSLRILPAADEELFQAAVWYDEREGGVGSRFLDAYASAKESIARSPSSPPRLETVKTPRDIRRVLLKRFPFAVVYEVLPDQVVILAVAHTSRRPNYWLHRTA